MRKTAPDEARPGSDLATRERFWSALVSGSADKMFLLDAEGSLQWVGPSMQRRLGDGEWVGTSFRDLVHRDDVERFERNLAQVVAGGTVGAFELRWLPTGDEWSWLDLRLTGALHDPAIRAVIAHGRDVTDRKAAEARLQRSEELHRSIVERADEGIALVDRHGDLVFVNAALAEMVGETPEALAGRPVTTLLPDAHRERILADVLAGALSAGRREVELVGREGRAAATLLGLTALPGGDLLMMVTDITARRRVEQQLAHELLHDPLTGLPNSRLVHDRLEQALARRTDTATDVAVIVVDVDAMAAVNAEHGRAAGDALLRRAANVLVDGLPGDVTVGRWVADQLVVVREDVQDGAEALALARRLLALLSAASADPARPVSFTAGVTLVGDHGAEAALRHAEAAVAQGKLAGRGRAALYQPGAVPGVVSLSLPRDVDRALRDDELVLHYQPIVDLATGRPTALEALVRWEHPQDGLLAPESFLGLVTASRRMPELTAWVLDRACGDLASSTTGASALSVAVNLTADDLLGEGFLLQVTDALGRHGLQGSRLVVELTEGVLIEDAEAAVEVMRQLRALGVRIALDDFGTGYSGLSYLRSLPVDSLKIDQSFVAAMGTDDASAIVASVASLANAIGLQVVAEGVESVAQQRELIELGCQLGQGFLFSEAVPFDALGDVLRRLTAGRDVPVVRRGRARPYSRPSTDADVAPRTLQRIGELHREGASLATIAARLNGEGQRRPDGMRWHGVSVARVLATLLDPPQG